MDQYQNSNNYPQQNANNFGANDAYSQPPAYSVPPVYSAPEGTANPSYGYAPKAEKKGAGLGLVVTVLCILTILNTALVAMNTFGILGGNRSANTILKEQKAINRYGREIADDEIEISNIKVKKEEYSTTATGTIENVSKDDMADVRVTVACYDEDDNYLGTTSEYFDYIPAKTDCKLELYLHEETDSVEIVDVVAYYYDEAY